MVIKIENYKIYVHINKINGKLYFGQTKRNDVNLRFGKNGIQYKKCPYFWNAIQKYGWDNFEHIIIFENLSKEMADIIEKELIKKYDTTNYSFGYNLSEGGGNNSSIIQKEVYQYSIDGILIKKWESAQHAGDNLNIIPSNISACCLRLSLTCGNYVWSYIPLEKTYFQDINYSHCKKIKQYDKYGNYLNTYSSIKEASITVGIKIGSISNSCKKHGLALTHKKFRWTYFDDEIDMSRINDKVEGQPITVIQFSLNGQYIRTWESATEIEKELGYNHSNISACCNGRMKTYKGYIWKYKSNNIEYIENIDDYLKRKTPKEIKRYHKKVVQYDLNDNFIKLWDSALDANKHYAANEKSTCVQACCRGDRKSAYGFIWKYVD